MVDDKKRLELRSKILERIEESLRQKGIDPSVIANLKTGEAYFSDGGGDVSGGTDFWDLGEPKKKSYAIPSFSPESLETEEVSGEAFEDGKRLHMSEAIPTREEYISKNGEGSLKIERRGSAGRVVNTVDGPRVVTGSYRSKKRRNYGLGVKRDAEDGAVSSENEDGSEIIYEGRGILIERVKIRQWNSSSNFYGRFYTDAVRTHNSATRIPFDTEAERVKFLSYVPQYAHLTTHQLDFYLWLRENIRRGRYPKCDTAYLMLYIYEILNLSEVIGAEQSLELLSRIWLNYRGEHQLDLRLCEWMTDFCLIHGLALPDMLLPILGEIVPKAQLKEFYFDRLLRSAEECGDYGEIASSLIENSSDYNYRKSRYYAENSSAYREHIISSIGVMLASQVREKRGLFSLDRHYKLLRDSYVGAVVPTQVKKCVELEFVSFTRGAESREYITQAVKYAENCVRGMLGIRAKLSADGISAADAVVIDGYFAPLMPKREAKSAKRLSNEERFMPADYLKNYEAESVGFDISEAEEIERLSWDNTDRLTLADDGNFSEEFAHFDEAEILEGEVTFESADLAEKSDKIEKSEASDDDIIKSAIVAALEGRFREFARSRGIYEGELADRVNNIFLDYLGDVIIEDFTLIEDYREDVLEWMK